MNPENKKRDIIIILFLMVFLISIVWMVDWIIKDNLRFSVYENICENKTEFIPEDCLILSEDKVNRKFVEDSCILLIQEEGNRLHHCLGDKYVVELKDG